jgi:hypothetical protein
MQYSERVNWKYGVNFDGIERWMNPQEIVQTLIQNPKNAKYSARIQAQVAESVRKQVGVTLGWTRRNRNVPRRVSTPRPQVETVSRSRITYIIDGARITVPRGVSVEVEL